MPLQQLSTQQLVRRLLVALLLSALLTTLASAWIFHSANEQAANARRSSAHEHYSSIISGLEQRWGREAFNFKVRLESTEFVENAGPQKERLLAHLTAQGSSLEFPSLRIEDTRGELIVAHEHISHKLPKVRFRQGQESTWALDPERGELYMVFRQLVWLGRENGYLILFKPMDHALLTQYCYPSTRISLWWKDRPVASSEGDDGLAAALPAFAQSGREPSLSRLPWSATDPDEAPLLFIESTAPPLLSGRDLAVPLALSLLAFAFAVWAILGDWGIRTLKRVLLQKRRPPEVAATASAPATDR